MERPALPVAVDRGEGGDLLLARGEELLHREFGRGVEVARGPPAVGPGQFGGEGVEVRLVARRDLKRGRLDDEEPLRLEPAAECGHDPGPRHEERAAVAMAVFRPER